MKKCKMLLAGVVLLCSLLLLVSCFLDTNDLSHGYTVVYNDNSESDSRIKDMLEKRFSEIGADVDFSSDKSKSFDNEIVLGDADFKTAAKRVRNEISKNISDHIAAYSIRRLGSHVVIVATAPEAEALAVDDLFSLAEEGRLVVPKDYKKTVYFDLREYKASGEIVSYGDSISTVTDIAEIRLSDDTVITTEKGKTEYVVPSDAIAPLPAEEDISVALYHPNMTYEVSYNGRTINVKVSSIDGSASREYKVALSVDAEYSVSSEIVNKDGAKGVLTLLSDDGDQRTADFFYSVVIPKYDSFRLSVAMPTRELANLVRTTDGKAWLKDDNGNYVLEFYNNFYTSTIQDSIFSDRTKYATKIDFWKEIVSTGHIDVLSHSHTHSAWGTSDDITYDANGNIKYPAGNVIKELHASAQILNHYLGQETSFICRPGGHADLTSDYFFNLVADDNTFLGMRTSNGAPPLVGDSDNKLNSPEDFTTEYGRMRIATILAKGHEAALTADGKAFATKDGDSVENCIKAGVSAWTNYIDLAMEHGQWASIGFHQVYPDTGRVASGYSVFDSQIIQLMDYVQPLVESGDLWLATFTEAAKYYFEWSSAEVSATAYGTDRVEVTLTDREEDSRFDEALTVKVSVPADWTNAELDSYGVKSALEIHTAEDGTHFVYANIIPGDGVSVIRSAN